MDITKFNKELATKIAIAKNLEKSNEITAAIKLWVEISEMTLRFSKSRNLDYSFRNMLIKKTEGIIQHIKNLKSGKIIETEIEPKGQETLEEITEVASTERLKPEEFYTENSLTDKEEVSTEGNSKESKFVEDSEFNNIPQGFKEIQTKKDFKIVTPHDNDYVKKILKKHTDIDKFKSKKGEHESTQNRDKIELEQPKDGNKVICFACGAELPAKTKICPDCGTILK